MEVEIFKFQKLKNALALTVRVLRNVWFQHSEALVTDLISSHKPYYSSPPNVSTVKKAALNAAL